MFLLLDLMIDCDYQALPSYTLITPYHYHSLLSQELYFQVQYG